MPDEIGASGRVIRRWRIDLGARTVRHEAVRCVDLEDALGGIARATKLLETRRVADAYDPSAALIVNLGALSGTSYMTGLRTFFHAYSPLKTSRAGTPGALWSAGSCRFGSKLRAAGVEEIVFTGRADRPTLLRISRDDADPSRGAAQFLFEDASDLVGLRVNARIQRLHARFPEARFAVTGPAGDHWRSVRFAAIALSGENQLASGDPKPRWCGRGGLGGVMGSKNLVAIAVEADDAPASPQPAAITAINREIARGKGSARFREKDAGGGGGTWANYEALGAVRAVPEFNFAPSGTPASDALARPALEKGPWIVKAESCHRCGIRCHKNVHEKDADGRPGAFRAKLDYEPLNLLASNLGIFGAEEACSLVQLVDEMGMDAISCGVTLAYAMEWNRRHPGAAAPLAGGLSFGDFRAARDAIVAVGEGRLPELGQGTRRLAAATGEPDYAMESKGMEFPAYLPQTNPGYPFALAGGHMSMRTYLLLLYEKETGLDYWVDAITRRGLAILRDDILGGCKFAGVSDATAAEAVRAVTGLAVTDADLAAVIRRTHLRGWRMERRQGFGADDYAMPADVHLPRPEVQLPHFNTAEFFAALRERVMARFDEMARDELRADA